MPVIKELSMGDAAALTLSEGALNSGEPLAPGAKRRVDAALVRELVDAHHRFIWRLLGRLGVREAELDDTVQQVFMVLTQKSELEVAVGSERAFLFGVALKVARTHKRSVARRRESSAPPAEQSDGSASPEALAEQHQARRMLDQILDDMPAELRAPFILFELDDVATAEIASLLGLPSGTVASRLRRAREWFERRLQQLQARQKNSRGGA
jgi:RNA polymerase sigma-70 factor (ECF subfamily)